MTSAAPADSSGRPPYYAVDPTLRITRQHKKGRLLNVSRPVLEQHFNMPLAEVAQKFGVGTTCFKVRLSSVVRLTPRDARNSADSSGSDGGHIVRWGPRQLRLTGIPGYEQVSK